MYISAQYGSPVGTLTLCCRGGRLAGLWLEGQKYFGGSLAGKMQPGESPVLDRTREWLDRYFDGVRPDPAELPLAPEGTPFRQAVWKLLTAIPYGQTATYGELARRLGRSSASARAAGSAAGRNPISIIIPCHRLVGADGRLTGYAGGVDRKLWLLNHEGVDTSRLRL